MTGNLEELKKRLRECYMDSKNMLPCKLEHEAADAVEQLQSEKSDLEQAKKNVCGLLDVALEQAETLKRELGISEMAASAEAKYADEMKVERDAAKRENEELRSVWEDPAKLHVTLLGRGYDRMNALHLAGATDYDQIKRELEEARKNSPAEKFAIVIDRNYEGEGLSLAVHDGVNFMFSDGDCYDRKGDELDGCAVEFLTQYQLEKKLEEARKDSDRLMWWFSDADKGKSEFLLRYMDGVREHWSIDRWRTEIDIARQRQS